MLYYTLAMREFFRILCAIKMTNAAARQKLRGIYRYVAEGHDWDIRLVREEAELTADAVRRAESDGIDGYVISIPNATEALKVLAHVKAPIAAIECDHPFLRNRTAPTIFLRTDNRAIGRLAATHLLGCGRFGAYAFMHDTGKSYWSHERLIGLRRVLANRQIAEFTDDRPGQTAFEDWLRNAPRPVAVCAAWDTAAVSVLTCARRAGLSVPGQVAVLGVDDDECICTTTNPTLSTILVNREQQGYDAAVALGRLLAHRPVSSRPILCTPERVITRESTHALTPSRHLVERARTFIARHACEGIAPDAVAQGVGVSRRLLDLRFQELGEGTVQQALVEARFSHALQLSRTTTLSADELASQSGFSNTNAFRNLFKRRTGLSLSAWRKGLRDETLESRGPAHLT